MKEPTHRGTVALKKGGLVFSAGSPGELSGARIRDVAAALAAVLDLGGREVLWYGCDDFRKLGTSDGHVALLNPRMPELPQDTLHLAVNVDRKALKAPFEPLVCAIEIAGRFTAFATGLGDAFPQTTTAWVSSSLAIVTAHPVLSDRVIPKNAALGQKSDVPFAHAFTATAVRNEYSITSMVAGMALGSRDKGLKKFIRDLETIRESLAADRIHLPVTVESLAGRIRREATALSDATDRKAA